MFCCFGNWLPQVITSYFISIFFLCFCTHATNFHDSPALTLMSLLGHVKSLLYLGKRFQQPLYSLWVLRIAYLDHFTCCHKFLVQFSRLGALRIFCIISFLHFLQQNKVYSGQIQRFEWLLAHLTFCFFRCSSLFLFDSFCQTLSSSSRSSQSQYSYQHKF